MRDTLPSNQPATKEENFILNLDTNAGNGSHWVGVHRVNEVVEYFDSFGNLKPPSELVKYLRNCKIFYNQKRYQNYNTFLCGHLCLVFLKSKYI